MVQTDFNEGAGANPDATISQGEAKKLFAEARKYAYPTKTLGGFKLLYITDPDQPGAMDAMEKMYKLYEKVFPLEEERESMDNLMAALRRNKSSDGSDGTAPSREQWVLIENDKGEIVAANNSMVFSAVNNPEVSPYISGTTHMSYTFVDPAYRGQDHGERASGYSSEKAREFIAATFKDGRKPASIPMIEFAEQNAILKMTPEQVLVDTAGSRTDQTKRRQIFEQWGFRQLDLPSPYVQLPLIPRDEGGESGRTMDLICRGVPAPQAFVNVPEKPTEVPSAVAKFHLYQFMKQAVSKGRYDIKTDPDWIKQEQALDSTRTVRVMPELDHLALKDKVWQALEKIVDSPHFDSNEFSEKTVAEITGINSIPLKAPAANSAAPAHPQIQYTVA